ncbi:MAG: hypothetical protein ABH878_03045, partial [bacterium]
LNPDHREAQAGMARAEQLLRIPNATPYRNKGMLYVLSKLNPVALVMVFLLFVCGIVFWRTAPIRELTTAQHQQQQTLASIQASVDQLILKSAAVQLDTTLAGINLNIPGITQKTVSDRMSLCFDEGLFKGGTDQLKPQAATILETLGGKLAQLGSIHVAVIGCTDDLPLPEGSHFRNNEVLGWARALAAMEQLKESSHLPVSTFSLHCRTALQAPYPNDSPENRACNRTVILQISAKSER